jgi:hypothetical protein
MTSRTFRALAAGACSLAILVLAVATCGDGSDSASASDSASGVTVSVAGDQVVLKRTAKSTAGTDSAAGQVACTDDYAKLAKATTQPAPTQSWYAATLITRPAANEESTATLSHELEGDPDLCIAQTSDSSAQVVVYFSDKAKAGIEDLQNDGTREQQAAQASSALKSAAQAAVAAVSKGSFPDTASLVETITAQGFYVEQATDLSEVKDTGTMYVITSQTSKKRLVVALKNTKGAIKAATQAVKGSAKVTTTKP